MTLSYAQGGIFFATWENEYLLLRKACAACNVTYGTCSLAGAGYRIHETSENNPQWNTMHTTPTRCAAFHGGLMPVLFEK